MKKLLTIVFLLFGGIAFCSPVRSNVGAKGVADTGGEEALSAKSYVQDGLIAMWDGIENAGWGKHSDTSTTWKDLIGTKTMTLTAHGTFSSDALQCDGSGYAAKVAGTGATVLNRANVRQVEIVVDILADGIIAVLADVWDQPSANGNIRIVKRGNDFFTMNVSSASSGLKNAFWHALSGIHSYSIGYSTTDFISIWRDTNYLNRYYAFYGIAANTLAVGGRADYTDAPFKGRICSIRVYNRNLTEEEVIANYSIDKERFGLE